MDGAELVRLRRRLLDWLDEASHEVSAESGLPTDPPTELLVVDRGAWISGNLRTLSELFGDMKLTGAEAKLVSLEGGVFVGLIARAVLGQYDPFRDQMIIVHPNLGRMAEGNGLRWLLFHEATHLAQFRGAPWIRDRILELGREVLSADARSFAREASRELKAKLPDIVRWLRDALEGKAEGTPLLDILPQAQREPIMKLHALVTLLEGHATYVTDLIARRVLPDHAEVERRMKERRKRPPLVRLLEAIAGIEMKRQQYVLGRSFVEAVWDQGGAGALAPAWIGPDTVPTLEELRDPSRWLSRIAA